MSRPWYLIHTKPKEEERACVNLERQGYEVYLPRLMAERCSKNSFVLKREPLFPRYLFVQVPEVSAEITWLPIRSTFGVSQVVRFGEQPIEVPHSLVATLKNLEQQREEQPQELFTPGEQVIITSGPFSGIEAVFKMRKGAERVIVLIDMLNKQVPYICPPSDLKKTL